MATHPYISGPGNITQMVNHLRKSFPGTITSDIVKKLGLAPNNETYVLNVLHFIGVIDSEGKKISEAAKVFSHHKDEEFSKDFGELVKKAYSALFELHGENTWNLGSDVLITFFRQSDNTSSIIGQRQAGTFKVLAGLSGHGDLPEPKQKQAKPGGETKKTTAKKPSLSLSSPPAQDSSVEKSMDRAHNFGLTVRVEINLPADGSKETYDAIFKSIKSNLLGD